MRLSFNERRTRGCAQGRVQEIRGISLVLCEMWERARKWERARNQQDPIQVPKGRLNLAQHGVLGTNREWISPEGTAENSQHL
jgi:hypothetical protein